MVKATLIARLLLGLIFVVFGLNGFFMFIPAPPMPAAANEFMGAMLKTGYFMPVVKITEIVCGLILLSGMFVPLALVLLAPIALQIFLFHVFLAPSGLPIAIVILVLGIFLATRYWQSFKPLFTTRGPTN